MKEKNNKNNKLKIAYSYVLKDRTTMRKEAIEKKIKKFKQLYINTVKHEQDIRKWIETGTRKKVDIRRSLEGLENKYKELSVLNDEFERKGISELKLFDDIIKDDKYNLSQYEYRIENLYSLAKIEKRVKKNSGQSIYGKKIDLVTDIPGNLEMFGLVKNKGKAKTKKEKNKYFNFRKLGRRIAAFGMAMIMTIFAGAKVSDSRGHIDEKETNSYSDTNRKNENTKETFKETLYVEVAETIKQETESITQEETTPKEELKQNNTKENNIQVIQKEENKESILGEENNYYIAKAGTKYTEVSDGSGNVGYFSKDTEVEVFNRALVKTDKDGNKRVLEVTRIGQTWREYAEENGLNYDEFKEYMDNNKNIQKCVSLQSSDGKHDYGWVSEGTLEKIGEMER